MNISDLDKIDNKERHKEICDELNNLIDCEIDNEGK